MITTDDCCVYTATINLNIAPFWDKMLYSVVDTDQHFGLTCSLHLQGSDTSSVMKNSNLTHKFPVT
jgi:hypothetical protein